MPGEVHLDLICGRLLADPYTVPVLAARWVEECLWAYRREFDAPAECLAGGVRSWLVFEGLDSGRDGLPQWSRDWAAREQLLPLPRRGDRQAPDGAERADGSPGRRPLVVSDKPAEGYLMTPDQRLHKRHWLRKPQCQFGWDWSTRLVNVGIHKPVRLEWTAGAARVESVSPLVTYSLETRARDVRGGRWLRG